MTSSAHVVQDEDGEVVAVFSTELAAKGWADAQARHKIIDGDTSVTSKEIW